jgi:hypothetical protein
MRVRHLYIMAIAASLGCAATANTNNAGAPIRRGNLLTAGEISDSHADATSAYDAVARLRPNWLAPHGSVSASAQSSEYATVFIDGQEMGDVQALRNVQAFQVGEIRYYNVTEAGAKFGIRGGTTGAIEVTMKSPKQP